MLNYIEIQNFRGISHARVTGGSRLNVLVGPNGTGKTAFLEAIYLAAGNSPQNILKTKQWRGRETQFAGTPGEVYDALWSDTFRDPRLGRAEISLNSTIYGRRSVQIERTAPIETFSPSGDSLSSNAGMIFRWITPNGAEEIVPRLSDQGLQIPAVDAPAPSVFFMPARMNASETETARAFSQLSVEGKEKPFLKAFKSEFNWLSDISVEAPSGLPAVYARLPSGRKLPLTMISGGISHLAGLLLRLTAHRNSILLVDEIENGFYHDRYASIWRLLFDIAEQTDSQIFATSHSLECLIALRTALSAKADSITFLRSRLQDREVALEQFGGAAFFGALDLGEVR